jgi:hypothetical protein
MNTKNNFDEYIEYLKNLSNLGRLYLINGTLNLGNFWNIFPNNYKTKISKIFDEKGMDIIFIDGEINFITKF